MEANNIFIDYEAPNGILTQIDVTYEGETFVLPIRPLGPFVTPAGQTILASFDGKGGRIMRIPQPFNPDMPELQPRTRIYP